MDYVVGSVADLISGNVSTPNRPRIVKRALTPVKRQQSPNVTPKSQFVDDRSIFLSPSVQKKKAIVKKSPKRIFEDQNLDKTIDGDDEPKLLSPKADKVKKHLKNELEKSSSVSPKSPKSPKKRVSEITEQKESKAPKKLIMEEVKSATITPKKNKQKNNSMSGEKSSEAVEKVNTVVIKPQESKSSKRRKRKNSNVQSNENVTVKETKPEGKLGQSPAKKAKKKHNKSKNKNISTEAKENNAESNKNIKTKSIEEKKEISQNIDAKKKNRKKKSKKNINQTVDEKTSTIEEVDSISKSNSDIDADEDSDDDTEINPNAITNADTDSEHESDDEIESETEQANNEILDTGPVESSDNEEEEKPTAKSPQKKQKEKPQEEPKEDEVKRTLFVGNVLFSAKCKKEIKKLFSKYGTIETVRIRTVPVKDARVTPKLAVIKNELHPERSTVHVYVKFQDQASVYEALKENNTELNGCHLRVSRSDTTGAEHDPKCSVFVGNLPFAIEDETLRAKFQLCGEIESVRIIRDKKTNAGKGFGYVNFASKDGVELALNLSEEDLTIKNRILRVKRCTQTNKQGNKPATGNKGRSQGANQRSFGNNQRSFGNNSGDDRGNMQKNFGINKFGNKQGNNFGNRNGNDRFANKSGNDRFANKSGNDRFANRNGNDRFANKSGNDRFANRNGNDRFANRNGNDRFANRNGNDRFANKDGNNKFNNNKFGNDKGGNNRFDGAYRRLQNKRPNQDGEDGPKPKKQRKEFVGMTAEKKKKRTFNKGQKKKKALSEILSK